MRKTLLLSSFVCLVSVLMAQPVLDQSSIGSIGSVYQIGLTDTLFPASEVGSAGANQTWDFRTLVAGSFDTITYVTAASTGYASDFPTSNFAIQQASLNNGFGFMESNTNSLQLLGFVGDLLGTGTPIVAHQTPAMLVSQFPFTYNDAFANTSTLDVSLDASGFGIPLVDSARFKNIQVRNLVADGYGTLELPTATYSNVLRIKEINTQTDSTWIHSFFGWQLFSDSLYTDSTFTWSDNAKGYLLAQASYIGGALSRVRHQDYVVVGRPEPIAAGYQVYPNPANDRILVKGDGVLSEIRILDLQGRVVMTQRLMKGQTVVFVNPLTRGCYLYGLYDENGAMQQSGKLILVY